MNDWILWGLMGVALVFLIYIYFQPRRRPWEYFVRPHTSYGASDDKKYPPRKSP